MTSVQIKAEIQTLAIGEARTYIDADMLEPQLFDVAGGTAAVVTERRPEKEGPNEDAAAIVCTGENSAVLIVSDGCGGMASGQAASRIAVESLVVEITAAVEHGLPQRMAILDGIEKANRDVIDLKIGAGATLAVVHIEDGEARSYHVGDSQILLVGGRGKVKLLTTSHSPVGYAMEAGVMDESEAIDHEDRHLVSNVLGAEEMHVEVGSARRLADRDGLLVASDGLLDNLLLDEIIDLLRMRSVAEVSARLAGLGRQRMQSPQDGQPHKPDDLTLIAYSRRGRRTSGGASPR
ncbi:MAG: protein phosphatase 2C domain-containing protein [Planctomycetales bacterium]|nr:protein phosphatase 2C domain-containing protein [Planctomycetales bacterium]